MISNINYPDSLDDDKTLFVAVNNLRTSLTSSISNSQLDIPVVTTSGFPDSGFITILSNPEDVTQAEAIRYEGLDATTFSGIERGAEGTPALAHGAGDFVDLTVVADHHNVLKDAVIALERFVGVSGSANFVPFEHPQRNVILPAGLSVQGNTTISGGAEILSNIVTPVIVVATGIVTEIQTQNITASGFGNFQQSLTISGSPVSTGTGPAGLVELPDPVVVNSGIITEIWSDSITASGSLTISGSPVATGTTSRKGTLSFTSPTVAGLGGVLNFSESGFNNRSLIRKLKVTPNTPTVNAYQVDFYRDTTFSADQLEYRATASGIFIDNGVWFHEDRENTGEVHIKLSNNSIDASTFTFEITAEVFA